jgi:2-polyprenyl-6-methoxyphenol hydroxylase-like FAD-dependent oxidoreductase
MRIDVAGAGPAGLAFAYYAARARADLRVVLTDPATEVEGAGIVLPCATLDEHADLLDGVTEGAPSWSRLVVRLGPHETWSEGHNIVGLGRSLMVAALRRRVRDLPNVRFVRGHVGRDPGAQRLVVAAGAAGTAGWRLGANRRDHTGNALFVWCSVDRVLPPMFQTIDLPQGRIVVHGYPHARQASTLVVEALPDTVRDAALTGDSGRVHPHALGRVLAPVVGTARVVAHTRWSRFRSSLVTRWYDDDHVLVGDAAHRLHFSIGSGTTLALDGARALAQALVDGAGPADYEHARRDTVEAMYAEALTSQQWFEDLANSRHQLGLRDAFALRSRREVNGYAALRRRDPAFVTLVRREFSRRSLADDLDLPPHALPYEGSRVSAPTRVLAPAIATTSAGRRVLRGRVIQPGRPVSDVPDADVWIVASTSRPRVQGTRAAGLLQRSSRRPVVLLDRYGLTADDLDTQLLAGAFEFVMRAAPDTPVEHGAPVALEPAERIALPSCPVTSPAKLSSSWACIPVERETYD